MNRNLIFAFFAATILFAIVREWNVPVACLRLEPTPRPLTLHR